MIVVLFVILAVFAPLLAPYGEAEVFPKPVRRGPRNIGLAQTRLAEMCCRA